VGRIGAWRWRGSVLYFSPLHWNVETARCEAGQVGGPVGVLIVVVEAGKGKEGEAQSGRRGPARCGGGGGAHRGRQGEGRRGAPARGCPVRRAVRAVREGLSRR
jgi:hypothetical protein